MTLKEHHNEFYKRLVAKNTKILKAEGDKTISDARSNAPVETGALRDSLECLEITSDKAVPTISLQAGVPYAVWVEEGTSKLAPQPFLKPAVHGLRGRIPRAVGAK